MPSLMSLAFIIAEIYVFIQTTEWIPDAEQVYIHSVESLAACYIH